MLSSYGSYSDNDNIARLVSSSSTMMISLNGGYVGVKVIGEGVSSVVVSRYRSNEAPSLLVS